MESIDVSKMIQKEKKYFREFIIEQCFFNFICKMKEKCEKYNIEFVQVPEYYPSSKTCSKCGHIKEVLKRSDRTYICDKCGLIIDRDFNAAINLEKYISFN